MPKTEPQATVGAEDRKKLKVESVKKDPTSGQAVSPAGGTVPHGSLPVPAATGSTDGQQAASGARPAPARRPLGAKEPIQFFWKLVGVSDGLVLTLFKSIEKDEADAQYERLKNEGYYKNLAVVDINAKIVAPHRSRKKEVATAKAKKSRAAAQQKRDGRGSPRGAAAAKSTSGKARPKPKRAKEASSKKSTSTVSRGKSKRSGKTPKKAALGRKRAASTAAKAKTAKPKKKVARKKAKR